MSAFTALVRKDMILYLSNRRALAVSLVAPVLIAGFFGAVLGGPPKKPSKIPIAMVDLDASKLSGDIVAALKADPMFELREVAEPEAVTGVRNGKMRLAIVIPKGFGDAAPRAMFMPGPKPEIVLHVDPSQAMTLAMVKGILSQHVMQTVAKVAFGGGGEAGAKVLADARADLEKSGAIDSGERRELLELLRNVERLNQRRSATAPTAGGGDGAMQMPFVTREQEVTSGERRYNAYAHSFAGMSVQFVLFMGIELGVGVLYMRRLGLWKRLRAAPVSRALLLGSRIASGTLIATILMLGIYAAAIAFFGVRVDGSYAGFLGVTVAFAFLTSTFGLLIAALGRTPEATRGIAILATLFLVMLGGAWIPTFVFPQWLQSATLAVPTRWAIDGLEGATWRGLGLDAALAPIGVMVAFSIVFAALAMWRFDWEE